MQIIGPTAEQNSKISGSDVDVFKNFLADPKTSIPINSNFLIGFKNFPQGIKNFTDEIINQYEPQKWGVNVLKTDLISNVESKNPVPPTNSTYFCLFANGVVLPAESVGVDRAGMASDFGENSGGILSGVVSKSRAQQQPLNISFLETTNSFIDFVIRPWIVAVSHYGLIARPTAFNIKTNLFVIFFDRYNQNEIRKAFTFYGCAPIMHDPQTADYGPGSLTVLKTSWAYNSYSISNKL